jgi:hypothetical protein
VRMLLCCQIQYIPGHQKRGPAAVTENRAGVSVAKDAGPLPLSESGGNSEYIDKPYKSKFAKAPYDAPGVYDPFGLEQRTKRLAAEENSRMVAFQKWIQSEKTSKPADVENAYDKPVQAVKRRKETLLRIEAKKEMMRNGRQTQQVRYTKGGY